MKTVELTKSPAALLADFVGEAAQEPVVVTLRGRPVAAITAIGAHTDLENLAVSNDPGFRALIERSRTLHPAGTGLSTEEVRGLLGLSTRRHRRTATAMPRRRARRKVSR